MRKLVAIFSIFISISFLTLKKEKPVFYIIGDSTVKMATVQEKIIKWDGGL
jgi:hypothetical protein